MTEGRTVEGGHPHSEGHSGDDGHTWSVGRTLHDGHAENDGHQVAEGHSGCAGSALGRLIPFDEHLADVLACVHRLPTREYPLAGALGLVLAQDVRVAEALPPFDCSAMDGYAVRRCDCVGANPQASVRLDVVADVPAGSPLDPPLAPGQCARIMTGAAVPSDADAIVPLEDTDLGLAVEAAPPGSIGVLRAPAEAAHIRRTGEDAQAGDLAIPAGRLLGPREVAAIAAVGLANVVATARVRVLVVVTGDELRPPGVALTRGAIRDSNGPLLAALVADAGADLVGVERVGDDSQSLRDALARHDVDLVITTGGVSVGAFDVVRLTLADAGIRFLTVAMQPGKPQGFGRLPGGALCFALPGNPVSVFASFEAFVRPALHRMAGRTGPAHRERTVRVARGWRTPPRRLQLMPVCFTDSSHESVEPATSGGSGSHLVVRLARAQALAVVPAEVERVEPGSVVGLWELTR